MVLSLEQIQSVTFGAVNVFKDDDGIHFHRFTDSQFAVWGQHAEQYAQRSHCTAGCQLSFYTDSQMLLLGVASGAKYEVFVNGLPIAFFKLDKPQRLPVRLGAGDKHVVITLPNYSEGILSSVALDEGSYVRPYTYKHKFLFLGDSITQGAQSTQDSFCYVNRVSRFFDAQIMNLGVGGSVMIPDTLEDVGFEPDAVFIAYGTNDLARHSSFETQVASCKEYFDRIQTLYPNKKVYYISPLWRADKDLVRKIGTLDVCRQRLIEQCKAHGFIHIDGYRLVPHLPFYMSDGYLHPNDLGFSLYAENLIQFLLKHL